MSAKPAKKQRADRRGTEDTLLGSEEIDATGVLDLPTNAVEKSEGLEAATFVRSDATAKPSPQSMTRLQRVESIFRIGSLAAISASAVLAAVQFYQERIDAQKERSTDLMLMWQNADARDSYARLRGAVEIALTEQGPIPANIPEAAYDNIKYNIGQGLIVGWQNGAESEFTEWSKDMDTVYQFYTEVEFCIRAELCNEELLRAYFAEEAVGFWNYFKYFAELQRDGLYPNYGVSVEKLVAVFNID